MVALAVEAARRFRPPRGLGTSRFEGCQVLVLADAEGSVAKLDQVIERVRKDATQKRWVMRQEVFSLSEKFEDEQWEFRIVRPSPREILFATDESYLNDVLARLELLQKGGKRPVDALAGFPGWKHVDTAAPFWAVRRYDVGAAQDDPSSAIGLHTAAPMQDESARGLTICYVPGKPGRIRMHYLTAAHDAKKKAAQLWRAWGLLPKESASILHEVEPGVIRLEADIGALSPHDWAFGIMGLIGHVIFL